MQVRNKRNAGQERIFSVLDIGTSKICCLIGRYMPYLEGEDFASRLSDLMVLGVGHQGSAGIKSGVVIDMDEAEEAIRGAVGEAERMAGQDIDNVFLSVSCGRIQSENFSASDRISGRAVHDQDIQRVMDAGYSFATRNGRAVLHMMPVAFKLNEHAGIRDPRGMVGEHLTVDIHAVTAEISPLRNLKLAVEQCHLSVAGMVAASYASGLATIVPDESKLGVTCIDMGGGTTKLAVFAEGNFVYSDCIALGGRHVTLDIARTLSTPLHEAERIKTLYGSVVSVSADDLEILSIPRVGEETLGHNSVTRGQLGLLIRPRIEEILCLLRDRMEKNGFARFAGQHVVLTGGTSRLAGLDQLAAQLLGKSVRIGRPRAVSELPEYAMGPEFATMMGLLFYPLQANGFTALTRKSRIMNTGTGYFARMGQWIRESF